ncbi:hypothetical protein [Actinoplanes sp. NPDC023714]|uniref:hypothetical protein n=1 Tax=Actinoplanes sp. NPDC023714 TaxID=3154322 RepID=UPI00340D4372
MAIEWETRVDRAFSLRQAAEATGAFAAALLGADPGADLGLIGVEVLDADAGLLDLVWEPAAPELRETVFVRFHIPRWSAGMCQVMLSEATPRHEDSESGLFVTVTPARDDPSLVLSIAAVCGFARVGGGSVIDEWNSLRGGREQAPAAVVERLGLRERAENRDAGIAAVLARTSLGVTKREA